MKPAQLRPSSLWLVATLVLQACELPVTVGRECAGESCSTCDRTQAALDMLVVLDSSGLQVFSWADKQRGFAEFLTEPASAGVGVGLQLSGESCDATDYETPTQPIARLPDNASAVLAAFPPAPPTETATRPALEGAIRYARHWQDAHATRTTIVTLVTDSIPKQKCDSSAENVAQVVGDGLAGSPSIRTFVVSIDALGSIFGFVSQVTAASGVPSAPAPVQSAADLARAFAKVRDDAAGSSAASGCEEE